MADTAEDLIITTWCAVLPDGRRERAGWRFSCPCCGAQRVLSVQAKGRYPNWNNHCPCLRDEVRAKLAALGLVSARAPRLIDRGALIALAEDRGVPDLALRVALLELAGIGRIEACDRLGISRAQRYRIVSPLRQNRRS
jgi:hypothetical protein